MNVPQSMAKDGIRCRSHLNPESETASCLGEVIQSVFLLEFYSISFLSLFSFHCVVCFQAQIPASSVYPSSAAPLTKSSTTVPTMATKPVTTPVHMGPSTVLHTEPIHVTPSAASDPTTEPAQSPSYTHLTLSTEAASLQAATGSPLPPPADKPAVTVPETTSAASVLSSPSDNMDHVALPTEGPATAREAQHTDPPTTLGGGPLHTSAVAAVTPSPHVTSFKWPPSPFPTTEALTSAISSPQTPSQVPGSPVVSDDAPGLPGTELSISELPTSAPPQWLVEEGTELQDTEDWMDLLQAENDTSLFSASTLLSGDGDSSERDVPDFPRILHPDLDYQYDAPEFWEEVNYWPFVIHSLRL